MDLRRAVHTTRRVALLTTMLVLGVGTPSYGSQPFPARSVPPEGSDSFAVQPSGPNGPGGRDYFVYTLKVGEVFGDTVAVSNLGSETTTFVVYATDARNTTDGSFTLLREEETPTDVGSWVELGATQYTLEPGKRVDIPFSLTVPADATPGDHAGAIVAQVVNDPTVPDDGVSVDVRLRVGARIYVRVDGPLSPSMAIDDFAVDYDVPANPFGDAPARITYTITNTGNVRLAPVATLDVVGIFGLGRKQLPDRQIPELLPGSSLQIAETLQGVAPYIRLEATLALQSPNEGLTVRSSIKMWAIPWGGVIALGIVLIAVVAAVIWRRRRPTGATA